MSKKTVIVATPNAPQRNQIASLVNAIPDFQVIAKTGDLMNTYNQVEEKLPTAVLISDTLAQMPEFEVMRALFSSLDVRWLVLTAPNKAHRTTSFHQGGSDLFSVPGNSSASVIEGQLLALTRSRLQRVSATSSTFVVSGSKPTTRRNNLAGTATTTSHLSASDPIILIGASTGGVDAILSVLQSFPADCPPTLIVQHTGAGFGESLASLLNRQCAPSVSLCRGPTPLQKGSVTIGAGNKAHLILESGPVPTCNCIEGAQVSGHKPSVDVLFQSGIAFAKRISAAILTGMGRDGAEGLLSLQRAGARTIAQDEASSVVFGMPRAAIELGGAMQTLPVDEIGPALLNGPNRLSLQPRKVLR